MSPLADVVRGRGRREGLSINDVDQPVGDGHAHVGDAAV